MELNAYTQVHFYLFNVIFYSQYHISAHLNGVKNVNEEQKQKIFFFTFFKDNVTTKVKFIDSTIN